MAAAVFIQLLVTNHTGSLSQPMAAATPSFSASPVPVSATQEIYGSMDLGLDADSSLTLEAWAYTRSCDLFHSAHVHRDYS